MVERRFGSLEPYYPAAVPPPNGMPLVFLELLKSGHRRKPDGQGLAGRDVVVAISRRPITLVEDVFDVELRPPGFVDLLVDRRIEADEARQCDRVVRRGKGIGEKDNADGHRPVRID